MGAPAVDQAECPGGGPEQCEVLTQEADRAGSPGRDLDAARHRDPVATQQFAHRCAGSDPREGLLLFGREHQSSPYTACARAKNAASHSPCSGGPMPEAFHPPNGASGCTGSGPEPTWTMPAWASSSTRLPIASSELQTAITSPCSTPLATAIASSIPVTGMMTATG